MAGDLARRRLAWLIPRLDQTGEVVRVSAEASPGPWWGFNGIHTLAVTDHRLWTVRTTVTTHGSGPDRARVLASSLALTDLEEAIPTPRAGLLAQPGVCVLRLRVRGRRGVRIYTFKDVEAARRLTEALTSSGA